MIHALESISGAINRLTSPVNRRLFQLSVLACGLLSLPIFFDVVGRFLFNIGLDGIIEIGEFLFCICVFSSLAYLQQHNKHIQVDMFIARLSDKSRALLFLYHWCVSFMVFVVFAWQLFIMAVGKQAQGGYSYTFEIPIWIFIVFGGVCMVFFALVLLRDILDSLAQCFRHKSYTGVVVTLVMVALSIAAPFLLKGTDFASDKLALGLSALGLMLALLFAGMPIGFAMAVIGLGGLLTIQPKAIAAMQMTAIGSYNASTNYTFIVVPLFMIMGELAYQAGISRDLFRAAKVWFGRLPGGLAVASVAGCAGFAAVCGESLATAITMASSALPEMRKNGYHPAFSCATLAAGGTLGILIPPSTGFIFYAIITEASIGRLFMAGIMPGLLLAGLFMLVVFYTAYRHPEKAPRGDSTTWKEKFVSLRGIIGMFLLIMLILGGILSGMFSPNEGGAVGAVGTCIYAICRRTGTRKGFLEALQSTTLMTGKLITILIGVATLGYFFAATRLPTALATQIGSLEASKYVILGCIILFYIVMGCVMSVIPMILLTLPALYPTVLNLGFDPIWFGVVVVILMEMALITPPVGVNVFGISGMVRDVPMASIFKEVIPFFSAMCVCILLLILFPQIALWLPSLFF